MYPFTLCVGGPPTHPPPAAVVQPHLPYHLQPGCSGHADVVMLMAGAVVEVCSCKRASVVVMNCQ